MPGGAVRLAPRICGRRLPRGATAGPGAGSGGRERVERAEPLAQPPRPAQQVARRRQEACEDPSIQSLNPTQSRRKSKPTSHEKSGPAADEQLWSILPEKDEGRLSPLFHVGRYRWRGALAQGG